MIGQIRHRNRGQTDHDTTGEKHEPARPALEGNPGAHPQMGGVTIEFHETSLANTGPWWRHIGPDKEKGRQNDLPPPIVS